MLLRKGRVYSLWQNKNKNCYLPDDVDNNRTKNKEEKESGIRN